MSQLLFQCYWKLVPLMRVCILTTCILTKGSMSKYYTDFKCCRSVQFPLFFLHSNGVTQMSTDAPFQCYASHHIRSLPSIPENGRRVCIWIRCVDIEQQFSIARKQWSEQQFLQFLTTAGLWDVCQFLVVCNHKYKNQFSRSILAGLRYALQAAHLHPYYIMTMKGVNATASRPHTYDLYTNALTVYI